MNPNTPYAFSPKVLRRWAQERLSVSATEDGNRIHASFRFDGSTCSNIPLSLEYCVTLHREDGDYQIRGLKASAWPDDDGHRRMCSYQQNAERIMNTLQAEKPLVGKPLSAVIDWNPDTAPDGCVCAATSRNHKWLAVLQTLHFALNQKPEPISTP